jgi:hypothetical protein
VIWSYDAAPQIAIRNDDRSAALQSSATARWRVSPLSHCRCRHCGPAFDETRCCFGYHKNERRDDDLSRDGNPHRGHEAEIISEYAAGQRHEKGADHDAAEIGESDRAAAQILMYVFDDASGYR